MRKRVFNSLALFEPSGLVIFDRDGTLIENIKGLSRLSDVLWKQGILDCLKELTDRKYVIAVSTNQGAIEEGLVTVTQVEEIHEKIVADAEKSGSTIWAIAYCPHSKFLSGQFCSCRKPKSGMLEELISDFGNEKIPKVFIGDSETDRLAALNSRTQIAFMTIEEFLDPTSAARQGFFR
jgi:D-glycero-D-manno-heptose 1,7-bisphosphate phosphatase